LSLAETLVASGELADGIQLLALTTGHPAADSFTRERAAADLEALESDISPAEFERLIARGRSLSLDDIREA